MAVTSTAWAALVALAATSDAALFQAMSLCVDDVAEDVADISSTVAAAEALVAYAWELDPEQLISLARGMVEWLPRAIAGCQVDQLDSLAAAHAVWIGPRDAIINIMLDPAGFFNPDPVPDVGERSASALVEALGIINTMCIGVADPE